MKLRPYQQSAIESISAELAKGNNRLLMSLATGLGKTFTFSSMLDDALILAWRQQVKAAPRTLIIAHREELLDQSAQTLRRLNPSRMVSIEQGARHANRFSDVVVASIQTLAASKCRRLFDLIRFQPFGIVIVDEAHHAAAASYRTVLVHLGFLPPEDASDEENDDAASEEDAAKLAEHLAAWDERAPRDRFLLGVTATPNRSDAIGLGCVFQSIAFTYPIRRGVEDGFLVPIVPWVVDTSVSLDGVRTNRGDFNQRELADAVNNEHRNGLAVDAWHKHAHMRPTIAFTVDVQHAHDLAAAFRGKGIRAAAVSGETPKDQRRAMLEDFRRGALDVLANCMILTEGTDLPMASCIVHAKPTKSATLYEQMTGRGLRLHPNKADCIVIDMVDVARKHSLQTATALYGLPPGLSSEKGKTLPELADAWDQFVEAHPGVTVEKMGRVAIEQLQVKASTFDIWAITDPSWALGSGRAMQWVQIARDRFRLQFPWQDGTEILQIEPDLLGQYAVSCTFRPAQGPPRQRTLASSIPSADAAAGLAEAYILSDRRSVANLTNKDAGWRKQPATDRQLAALRWRKIPHSPDISKGQASALLDLASARAGK